MTLATLHGRIQTKLVTYVLLAAITIPFVLTGGIAYIDVFVIALFAGIVLESIWGLFISHQLGWVAFLLAGIEFLVILIASLLLNVSVTLDDAVIYYVTSWVIIQLFLIYLMPILKTDWADNGSEIW